MKLVGLTAVLLIATTGVASPTLAAMTASGAAMDEAKARWDCGSASNTRA